MSRRLDYIAPMWIGELLQLGLESFEKFFHAFNLKISNIHEIF